MNGSGWHVPDQLHPSVATGLGVHRDSGGAERLDVPIDRAHRHFQLIGELGGGEPAAVLQEQQDGHQMVGADSAPDSHSLTGGVRSPSYDG